MKRALAAALVLVGCRASTSAGGDVGEDHAAEARAALLGKPAPAASLAMLDGSRVELRDWIGREPIYLKFWATWCRPCLRQTPHLEAAHRTYGDRIRVVAVDLGLNDSVAAVRSFQAENAMTVPIAIDDGSLAERFHVAVTPMHIVIDRAGVVRHVGHGATAELDRALAAVAGDQDQTEAPRRAAEPPADAPLSLTLLDQSTFTLAAHAGRPVALTFVLASCDWYLAKSRPAMSQACMAHARQVDQLQRARPDIAWVTIAHPVWTSSDDLAEYRARLAVATPIALDGKAAWFRRFRVHDVPTTVLLDERGAEVERVDGPGDDLPGALSRLRPAATR